MCFPPAHNDDDDPDGEEEGEDGGEISVEEIGHNEHQKQV